MEASEFVSEEAPHLFWKFLEQPELDTLSSVASTDKSTYEAALSSCSHLLSASSIDALKIALSIRVMSPAVQAVLQISADACQKVTENLGVDDVPIGAWATVGANEEAVFTVEEMTVAVERALAKKRNDAHETTLYEFDHIYPSASLRSGAPAVILYADIATKKFRDFHKVLEELARSGSILYALRHHQSCLPSSSAPLVLQGYGAELTIKNMEYNVIDDSQLDHDESSGTGDIGDFEADTGSDTYVFDQIAKKHPALKKEMLAFKAAFPDTYRPLEEAELKNVGIQAASLIARSLKPLRLMKDINGNLPSLAPALAKLPIEPDFLAELEENQRVFSPGINVIYLNGMQIDVDEADPFKLLQNIREEIRIYDRMSMLLIDSKGVRDITSVPPQARTTRIDVRSPAVLFLNDIEQDKMYSRFGSSVYDLLGPMWPGQFRQVRKNLYNVVYVIDPASSTGLTVLEHILHYYNNGAPLRFGVVFVSRSPAARGGSSPGSSSSGTTSSSAWDTLTNLMDSPVDAAELLEEEGADFDMSQAARSGSSLAEDQTPSKYSGRAKLTSVIRRCFGYLHQHANREAAFSFLQKILLLRSAADDTDPFKAPLSLELLEEAWDLTIMDPKAKKLKDRVTNTFAEVTDDDEFSSYDTVAEDFVASKGLWNLPHPIIFLNGRLSSGLQGESQLFRTLQEEMQLIMTLIRRSIITDKVPSIYELILKGSPGIPGIGSFPRYNSLIFPATGDGEDENGEEEDDVPLDDEDNDDQAEPDTAGEEAPAGASPKEGPKPSAALARQKLRFVSLAEWVTPPVGSASVLDASEPGSEPEPEAAGAGSESESGPGGEEDLKGVVLRMAYLTNPEAEFEVKSVTHWLVADWTTPTALRLLSSSLASLVDMTSLFVRVGLLHNGDSLLSPSAASQSPPAALHHATARVILAANHVLGKSHRAAWSTRSTALFLRRLLALHDVLQGISSDHSSLSILEKYEKAVSRLCRKSKLPAEVRKSIEAVFKPDTTESKGVEWLSERHRHFARDVLGVPLNVAAVVTNGRVILLYPEGPAFTAADFDLLQKFEEGARASHAKSVAETLQFRSIAAEDITSEWLSDVIMAVVSLLGRERASGRVQKRISLPAGLKTAHTGAVLKSSSDCPLEFVAILDPLSPTAQRLTPLLIAVREAFDASLTLYLNPVQELTSLPLNNYYRYVLSSQLFFDQAGRLSQPPTAMFSGLPPLATLTLHLHTLDSWLTTSAVAVYDMDNIRLADLPPGTTVYAQYQLEHLVITGHCGDLTHHQPPRGLQMVLGNRTTPHAQDTLVMSNLGYFQLKALPGVWELRLASGRASKLYRIVSVALPSSGARVLPQYISDPSAQVVSAKATRKRHVVVVNSFKGVVVPMWVKKNPGFEQVALLDENAEDDDGEEALDGSVGDAAHVGEGQEAPSLWSKFKGLLSPDKPKRRRSDKPDPMNDAVNIFSVASGHLYERFLKIMVWAVRNRTSGPVRFWFIKNYLSPNFKNVMPHMAQKYNFSYELVTYKWPSWLHKQTDKQRIIWAYKILFLDVLFPIGLKKVIFVDADQIVRTDMRELYEMDLEGAPIAMTPFCDSNKAVEGYRFWKSGFWKEHLRGSPYHISALFVVDLAKLRRVAAGDQYRVFYEQLSKDPNSLANLDQDLPNYAQHHIPIHSLPADWLWCETWCDQASKPFAKTIDLCNNPMTKERKLDVAKRIVEEWVSIDDEIKAFEAQLKLSSAQVQPPTSAQPSVALGDSK